MLDRLSSPGDPLWPDTFPPMRFDRPLGPGATGGHDSVLYSVESWTPGERVVFRFDPAIGLIGTHMLEVLPSHDANHCILRHTISAVARGSMRLQWPLAIRWLHDECLRDLLDRAETTLTGELVTHRRTAWVALMFRFIPAGFVDDADAARAERDAGILLRSSS